MLLTFFPATAAGAVQICDDLEKLLGQVHSAEAHTKTASEPPHLGDAPECTVAGTASRRYTCRWSFPLQAAAAQQTFEALDRGVDACIGHRAKRQSDRNVNHPDFYDSRRYLLNRASVTVSIKDKSALRRTFVTVWVLPGGK